MTRKNFILTLQERKFKHVSNNFLFKSLPKIKGRNRILVYTQDFKTLLKLIATLHCASKNPEFDCC